MNYLSLRRESKVYNSRLERFIEANKLPQVWFDEGHDHLAIKAYSLADYEAMVEQFKPFSERISEVDMDGRHIATARLIGNYALDMTLNFSTNEIIVKNIELMLARPHEQTEEAPELDHAEIFLPRGLIPVRKVLTEKGIYFDDEENDAHGWVSVIISEQADELKFTDRRLEDLVEEGIAADRARIL